MHCGGHDADERRFNAPALFTKCIQLLIIINIINHKQLFCGASVKSQTTVFIREAAAGASSYQSVADFERP